MKIDGLSNLHTQPKTILKKDSDVSSDFNRIMQNLREADSASVIKKISKDKDVLPKGTARTFGASGNTVYQTNTVDKTTELYAQALELESYFVKIMLTSMRNTLTGSGLAGDNSFASKMYKDMFYDELNKGITKNAGFGLADQIYLQLNGK